MRCDRRTAFHWTLQVQQAFDGFGTGVKKVWDQKTVNGSATNGKGRLTTVIDPSCETVFRYDTRGLAAATEMTTGFLPLKRTER